ncbi:MAG: hypothetical protein U0795_03970 [Pirellulales bacterium]
MRWWLAMTMFVLGTATRGWAIPPVGSPPDSPQPAGPAVVKLTDLTLKDNAFPQRPGRPGQPTVVKSEQDAAALFTDASVDQLKQKVDFAHQMVLVFAWQGSGKDELEVAVSESLPNDVVRRRDQVVFSFEPGRTRDLRPHTYVFAVKSDAAWSVGLSWKQAQEVLRTGKIQSVMQTHDRHVSIVLEDGTRYATIEPGIDDVIQFLEKINKNVPIATE